MQTITPEYLQQVWQGYRDREIEADRLAKEANNLVSEQGFRFIQVKMRHMREAIEGVIMDATGKLPEL